MHQFTLNSFGSWCLCYLPPKTLILSGAHKIHTCFLIKTVNSLTGKKPQSHAFHKHWRQPSVLCF